MYTKKNNSLNNKEMSNKFHILTENKLCKPLITLLQHLI